MTPMLKRLAQAVLLASLALPMTALLPAHTPLATSAAQAAEPSTLAEFRAVLAKYGTFGTHEKYGEIWVPTVTPPGWHPYPACQWVYTKNGWYFKDDTPWGSIVHHYGRWSHDEKIGWFWVPDEQWSPGWVVWRKSDQWVGWAPMPPRQDIQLVSSAEFNNDKLWTFMEASKFFNGECGGITVLTTEVFNATNYVTIFNLPPGLLVEVVFVPLWTYVGITELVVLPVPFPVPFPVPYPVPTVCTPNTPNNPPKPVPLLRHTDGSSPIHVDGSKSNPPNIKIDLPPRTGVINVPPRIGIIDVPRNPGAIDKPNRGHDGGANGGRGKIGKPGINLVNPSASKGGLSLGSRGSNFATTGKGGHTFVR
jgi:hypothetical protein